MNLTELIEKQREIDAKYFKGIRESTSNDYWCNAIGGEIGEVQNLIKKYERNHVADAPRNQLIADIAEECADVLIYAMIIGDVYRIDILYYHNAHPDLEPINLSYAGTALGITSGKLQFSLIAGSVGRVMSLLKIVKLLFIIEDMLEFDLLAVTHEKQLKNIDKFGSPEG